jgi:methyl-accepting chemotaxis protein
LAEKIIEIKSHITDIVTSKEVIVEQIENISAVSEESASALEEVNASTEVINDSMGTVSVYANELQQLVILLEAQAKSFRVECDERSNQEL